MAVFVKYNCNTNNNTINSFLTENSTATATHSVTGEPKSSGLRTYKRRKKGNSRDLSSSPKTIVVGENSSNLCSQSVNKMVNGLVDIGLQNNTCEQICSQRINCHSLLNGSDDRLSLDNGVGGIQRYIEDRPNNSSSINTNLSQKNCEHHGGPYHLERIRMSNGSLGAVKGLSPIASNGFSSQPGDPTVSGACEKILLRIVTLEKFGALCKLIMKNFPGIKVEEVFDFDLISSRIKGGTYEHTPSLFSSDIQQIWRKLHSIGSEMVLLSQTLSQLTRDVCHELLSTQYSDTQNNREELMPSIFCTCRQCGKLSDGSDCLVCDSCEDMFHLSCIQPTIKEIPHKSWYCAKCTFSGIGSSHEDCVVCDRLSDGVTEDRVEVFKGNRQLHCKMCGCTVKNGEEYRVCEHLFCQYKYYHTRCLSKKQSHLYGPRWYCPSCLCRVCLSDKDDDDLVMCDGCDHGYHIYCMDPPRTSVPKGKWYCSQCEVDLQAIRKAKKLYQRNERKKKNKGKRAVSICSDKIVPVKEEAVDASRGGMNMLLTAAKTLKHEESTW